MPHLASIVVYGGGRFLHLSARGGHVRLHGDPHVRLGQRVAEDDGVFAGWTWDGERLTVTNDRYGAYPLFYWAGSGEIALSTRVADLLALGAPVHLDLDALAAFLRLGFYLGEDTCFAAIRVLPPHACLTWTPDGVRLTSSPPVVQPVARTRRETVEGFIELFRTAISRRLPGEDYMLPLSGGRDSRHLLLELVRQHAPPRACVSSAKFPPDDTGDAQVARLLADAVGIPHEYVRRPRSRLATELAANLAQSLGTVEGGWTLPLLAHLRRHCRLSYDGIGGDVLSHRLLERLTQRRPYLAADPHTMAVDLMAAGRTDRYLPAMLGPDALRSLSRERAAERLVTELRRHADAASPWTSFFFWNRTRRATALTPYALFAGAPAVHAPFLDHNLFDFLMSVPPGESTDGTLHDDVIHRAYPRYAHIPWAATPSRRGLPLLLHRAGYLTDLLRHVATERRHWLHCGNGILVRLLRAGRSRDGLRAINRLLPLAIYLLQLEDLVRDSDVPVLRDELR
jgi:asparagine synthase (glutamine-hydrolysing)